MYKRSKITTKVTIEASCYRRKAELRHGIEFIVLTRTISNTYGYVRCNSSFCYAGDYEKEGEVATELPAVEVALVGRCGGVGADVSHEVSIKIRAEVCARNTKQGSPWIGKLLWVIMSVGEVRLAQKSGTFMAFETHDFF